MAAELSLYGAQLGERNSRLGQLLDGMITAQLTSVLARLGVPDQLAGGPLTAGQIAAQVGVDAAALRRVLPVAVVYGLISQDDSGRYALTPDGELLRTDVDGSARALAVGFFTPPMWASFGRLAEAVRHPVPVDPGAPGGIYAYYADHPPVTPWSGTPQ
jgi:hypothetical protein